MTASPVCTLPANWIPIVKYVDEGWVPTAEAHGDMMSEMTSDTDWAKLSDSDINSISHGSTWHYYAMTTESTFSTQKTIYIRSKKAYSDVSRSLGAFDGVNAGLELCTDSEDIDDCTWEARDRGYFDTVNTNYPPTDNLCQRWFTDYSGTSECYPAKGPGKRCFTTGICNGITAPPLTGVTIYKQCPTITEQPVVPAGTRCFNHGNSCAASFMKTHPMRMYVKMYKLVEEAQLKSWRLILQYGMEPYTPTPDAVGIVAEDNIPNGFAKLADDDINALAYDDDEYDYFMLTSPVDYVSGSASSSTMVIRTKSSFEDAARYMGIGDSSFCQGDDVTIDPAVDCASGWEDASSNRLLFPVGNNDCLRWLTDSAGTPSCHTSHW